MSEPATFGIPGAQDEWLSPEEEARAFTRIDEIQAEQQRSGFTSIEDTAWLTALARKLIVARINTRTAVIANAARVRELEDGQTLLPINGKQDKGWKRCADEKPDCDTTVMIHHPDEDEPVWMGYFDGRMWRTVEGLRCSVTHWMHLPAEPKTHAKP